MRLIRFALTALLLATPALAEAAIIVTIPEMDCEECSTALVTTFKRRPEIENVQADVASHKLTLTPRVEQNLDDATIRKLVRESGFTTKGIQR